MPEGRVRRTVGLAVAADVACVLAFVLVGTANHRSAGSASDVALVALPFLVGLAAGWVVGRAWRSPARVWPTGVGVWCATVASGLLLRPFVAGGLAWSFAIVTAVVLGVAMLGWRVLVGVLVRRRAA